MPDAALAFAPFAKLDRHDGGGRRDDERTIAISQHFRGGMERGVAPIRTIQRDRRRPDDRRAGSTPRLMIRPRTPISPGACSTIVHWSPSRLGSIAALEEDLDAPILRSAIGGSLGRSGRPPLAFNPDAVRFEICPLQEIRDGCARSTERWKFEGKRRLPRIGVLSV